jgi:hypothetical protein
MPEDMPEAVRVVIDVIGNNVRTEILRVLAQRPLTTLQLPSSCAYTTPACTGTWSCWRSTIWWPPTWAAASGEVGR